MLKWTLIGFCLIVLTRIHAQSYVDLFNSDAHFLGQHNYQDTTGTAAQWGINIGTTVPIPISEKLAFITGINYNKTSFYPNIGGNMVTGVNSGVKLGVSYKHSEKWSGVYFALPKLAGDLSPKGRDFQIGGVALWKYKPKNNMIWRFGAYANTEFFSLFAIPIVGVYFQSPNQKFTADVTMPITADANYKLFKNTKLGFNFWSYIRSFQLNDAGYTNQYIHAYGKEYAVYLQQAFPKYKLLLQLRGVNFLNDFALYNQNEKVDFAMTSVNFSDHRTRLNPKLLGGYGFKVKVIYRLELSN